MTTSFFLSRRERSDRLILYFNGWAMNSSAVVHLKIPEGYDLLCVQDYRSIDQVSQIKTTCYKSVHLVAWSMGVWAAECLHAMQCLPDLQTAVAVAGTPIPMDDGYGIPTSIFRATLANLSEENRERFNRRMCGGKEMKHLFEALRERPIVEIKQELQEVHDWCLGIAGNVARKFNLPWDRALVPMRDRIIPATNQITYWRQRGVPVYICDESEHYLFKNLSEWLPLLQ